MRSYPLRVAFICGAVLLSATVHAARIHGSAGVVDGDALGVTGAAAIDAQIETDAADDEAEPRREAAALSKRFYTHVQVLGCLESRLSLDRDPWHKNFVEKVWRIELNHTAQQIVERNFFASIKNSLAAALSESHRNEQKLFEQQKELMNAYKFILKTEYAYDYDAVKEQCALEVEPQFTRTTEMVAREFSGCSGGCSRKSTVVNGECREASTEKVCPEGTRCGCHFKDVNFVGSVVMPMALSGLASATVLGPPMLGAGLLASALAYGQAEGCRCLPSDCLWDRDRETCAPAPARGAKNPFQAVLPYIGMKCVAKPPEKRPATDSFINRICEQDARPCDPGDYDKIGQLGADTFNCRYLGQPADASTLFPPLGERLALYRALFPDVGLPRNDTDDTPAPELHVEHLFPYVE